MNKISQKSQSLLKQAGMMFPFNPVVQYYAGLSQLELEREYKDVLNVIRVDRNHIELLERERDAGNYGVTHAGERIKTWVGFLQEELAKKSVLEDLMEDEHAQVELARG